MSRRPPQDPDQLQLVPTRPLPIINRRRMTEAAVSRLYSRIGPIDGENCRWTGWTTKHSGHAVFSINKTTIHVHRLVYLLEVGDIPAGYHVHHRCHNPGCCNSAHLELLPHSEHTRLHMIGSNGGAMAAMRRARTHCQRCGQLLMLRKKTADKRGYERHCPACARNRRRASRLRRHQQLLLTTTAP